LVYYQNFEGGDADRHLMRWARVILVVAGMRLAAGLYLGSSETPLQGRR
jgi:L-fucose isomerase-like protein